MAPRKQSRAHRQAVFLESAQQMDEKLANWYAGHPEASFGEIEMAVRKQRRELMGETIAVLGNGRDSGFQLEAPKCPKCRKGMEFEGYRKWRVNGLEGDSAIERADSVCPECSGETIFPPG
jgi:hypothetical protein